MYLSIYSRCLMYVLHSSAILIHTSFLLFVATIQTLRYRHFKVISLVSELYRPRFYLKVAILSDFFSSCASTFPRSIFIRSVSYNTH